MPLNLAPHIQGLRTAIDTWVAMRAAGSGPDFVWNADLDIFARPDSAFDIRWIVVANNPGPTERGVRQKAGLYRGRYLHPQGQTGSWTRIVVGHETKDLANDVIFLEKSPIYSENADRLMRYKKHPSFAPSQQYIAELVFNLHQVTGASVWIQGFGRTYAPFFERLRILYTPTTAGGVYITDHLQKIIMDGVGFPAEPLLDGGLAAALAQLPRVYNPLTLP